LKPITVLYRGEPVEPVVRTFEGLDRSGLVQRHIVMTPPGSTAEPPAGVEPTDLWTTDSPGGADTAMRLLEEVDTPFLLEVDVAGGLSVTPQALQRLHSVACSSGAVMTYGDFHDLAPVAGGETDGPTTRLAPHPLADYQEGSVGDRFQFGPLRLWSMEVLALAIGRFGAPSSELRWHAWYDLRLKGSVLAPPIRLPEPLATLQPADRRASGAAVFDYLMTGRDVQLEAERVATDHLRRIGALVSGPPREYVCSGTFERLASVVIPVRDRVLTVADAVASALRQEATFPFNVIVVDNHSTDGTTDILADMAAADDRLVHVVPDRRDLGIGGCWNTGVFHPACGQYAVQLDSDDLYSGVDVLQRIIDCFRAGNCGMVIGSYTTVDLSLSEIPPGLIDHKEWTDGNGPNNALRIDGLGAPRAFATELVREHPFPNVSYGEDYAVALRISREYKVGRIFESLYHCRRWEDNTDADLSAAVVTQHQIYKDRVRSVEIAARRLMNRGEGRA